MNDFSANNISKIDPGKVFETKKKQMLNGAEAPAQGEFKEILGGFMSEVNDLQLQAGDKIEKLASGEIKDLHEVMLAATEADTSFKIMMEIRNKLMSAYKEIQKL